MQIVWHDLFRLFYKKVLRLIFCNIASHIDKMLTYDGVTQKFISMSESDIAFKALPGFLIKSLKIYLINKIVWYICKIAKLLQHYVIMHLELQNSHANCRYHYTASKLTIWHICHVLLLTKRNFVLLLKWNDKNFNQNQMINQHI